MQPIPSNLLASTKHNIREALREDIASGDVTAELIPTEATCTATIITREDCVLCGQAWVDETFAQLGNTDLPLWHKKEGDIVSAGEVLATITGNTRSILTGERTALNFLQLLSGIATKAAYYAKLVAGTNIQILDTRKTLPGLRLAQKYAVKVGGCQNHRIGLYDAFLIKENHIAACGSITQAVEQARTNHNELPVIVEVETIAELKEAISAKVDRIMLDNFDDSQLDQAAALKTTGVLYEVSGNITTERVRALVDYSIDCISIGDLTKNVSCVDLSMRL